MEGAFCVGGKGEGKARTTRCDRSKAEDGALGIHPLRPYIRELRALWVDQPNSPGQLVAPGEQHEVPTEQSRT